MASATDIAGSADAYLAAFVTQLTADGVTLPVDSTGAVVAYIAPGDHLSFAWDQPALVLTLENIVQGTPGNASQGNVNVYALTWQVQFGVTLVRQVSTLNDQFIPTPVEIAADGAQGMLDAQALLAAITALKANPPDFNWQEPLVVNGVRPTVTEGGMAGTTLLFTAVLK